MALSRWEQDKQKVSSGLQLCPWESQYAAVDITMKVNAFIYQNPQNKI